MRLRWVLVALAMAGCAGPTTPPPPPPTSISISDNGVFTGSARLSIGLGHKPGEPSDLRGGHAIEASYSRGSGSDTQTLSAGQQPVRFGNTAFPAPQKIGYDFDYEFAELAYRFRKVEGGFGVEVLGGVASASLGLTASSPLQRASENVSSTGLTGSFGLLWELWRGASAQVRGTVFGSGDDNGITEAWRAEAGLVQALGANFSLRAGWVYWDLKSDRGSSLSSIRAKLSGPLLGLELAF